MNQSSGTPAPEGEIGIMSGTVDTRGPARVEPVEPLLQWFEMHRQDAVTEPWRSVVLHYLGLAQTLVNTIQRSAERSVALRDLLTSLDAAQRARHVR